MATLVWDKIGDRVYQTGVDRGVLYLPDGSAVPWNGLVNVEESSSGELKSFYLDGVKYLQNFTPGDFLAKLKAFTYPDEFDALNGIGHVSPGMALYEQPSKSFGLSYRTQVGNDLEGEGYGYKIHVLYNVIANPDSYSFETNNDAIEPIIFGWSLTGTPVKINNFKPTVHISIDSRHTPPDVMTLVESKLYGTEIVEASLPSIQDLAEFFGYLGALIIVDNGDGSWLAIDESDTYISMISDSEFVINDADATFLFPDTYTISSTNVGG